MARPIRMVLALAAAVLLSTPAVQTQAPRGPASQIHPDFDVRDGRPNVRPRVATDSAPQSTNTRRQRGLRFNRESGSVRVLTEPGLSAPRNAASGAIRGLLSRNAQRLGLEPRDLDTLTLVRDYTSRSTNVRHLVFSQVVDGYPVFDSMIAVHLRADGSVLRITSNAASIDGRDSTASVTSARARLDAVSHAGGGAAGAASLVWLPVDGTLRLAWHVAVEFADRGDVLDVLVDAQSTELLLRRNRARDAEGTGRVLQSSPAADPRRPDAMPSGVPGALGCPPPVNHTLRDLVNPFRDAATVLASTGRLEGNNTTVFRGSAAVQAASGTFDGTSWLFDFPFNSPGSAETYLFFAINYAHDFFYDLGFDEAAGNFQVNNFGRGGLGGDPVKAVARAAGRNNANYVLAPDGSSPTINMFLWDGIGCWAQDVDGDGTSDLDGTIDLDIIVHEFHHGVSTRLNTAWTGNEAGAIGEGGGDFFAYSINGDTNLADYARPGGIRNVNGKGYSDWTCLLGLFCSVHSNGEIWANVLWDVRERFRTDLVRGSEAAAINETGQIYVDALKLSPPSPTMLDIRDAMLEADALRNPGGPHSQNFCRIWESFAARGMGVSATDTEDNGFNQVGAAFDVPDGCTPPPAPPTVTVTATATPALEAGAVQGALIISRGVAVDRAVTVNYAVGGTASSGIDYVALTGLATIPAGAASVVVPVTPIDDTKVENNETVTVSLVAGSGYAVGSPFSASVTIVSDDVAPDFTVTALTVPKNAGAGGTISITDTTKNQGTGPSTPSETSLYLSKNALLEAGDPLLGTRTVPDLAPGATNTGTVSVVLPDPLEAGTYYVFAKGDAANAFVETSETNNTRVATIAIGPDLSVPSVSAPATAAAGVVFAVTDTTANIGAGTAEASSTRYFLSPNILLDALDTQLQARSVPSLLPGATSTGITNVTIPAGTPSGTYYLIAQADAGTTVGEPNETNNTRSSSIRVGPDLNVSALTGPTRAVAGGTLAATDTTRNSGAGAAGASTTAFYFSTDQAINTGDFRLQAVRQVPALDSNEVSTGTTTVTLPDVAAGIWYLLATADDGNQVLETQETNNTRSMVVQVGPDLNFLSVFASGGVAGASIPVTATIRNSGAATAPASVIKFYLSSNITLDAADTLLETERQVPSLASDATNTATTNVALPSGIAGSFYLLVVADANQAIPEFTELNNTVARPVQIK